MPKSKKKSKKPPTKKLAAELEEFSPEEIDKILAEKSLHEFVKQAWHVIEPATDYCDNWHIEAICEHLQAVSAGTIKQILINVPPGTMKSLLVNVFWPAWEWGPNKHAEKRFMFSSYSEDLSMRDSVKCRDLICSEWYQTRWPLELSVDQNTKGKFQNTKRGWRMIGSIKGKGIGEHPDYMCVPGETPITCRSGNRTIKSIVEAKRPIEILSFNHKTGKSEWRKAYIFSKQKGRPCLKIKTSKGREITCTENHPIFIEGVGYIEARYAQKGDGIVSELHNLPKKINQTTNLGPSEILFSEVPRQNNSRESSSSFQRPVLIPLSDLQKESDPSKLREGQEAGILLSKMSGHWNAKAETIETLPAMRKENNRNAITYKTGSILLAQMCFTTSPPSNSRKEQSTLRSWKITGEIQERIYRGGKEGSESGQEMSNVRRPIKAKEELGCPPHRLQKNKQQLEREPDFTLPALSRTASRKQKEPVEMDADTVISIEKTGTPDFVYNIAVEENHNFFANGILTHNCCDDPHNTSEIESEQERQNVVDWIDNTFSTRGVSRKAAKVIIMQRLHVQDASGHVLSKGGWIHICLPMRYEAPAKAQQPDGSWKIVPRMTKTPLGWTDPRTKEGELLWPKLYPEETLQILETNLGQYGTAGQLQQRPTPRGGGMFKRVWFEILKECPALGKIVRYWDKACLVADTGIATSRGNIAIKSIKKGDRVYTFNGLRIVKKAWETKRTKEITSVLFSNGNWVTGTPDHRIKSFDNWIELATIRGNQNFYQLWQTKETNNSKPLSSTESDTSGKSGRDTSFPTDGTKNKNDTGAIHFTGLFGDLIMATFPLARISTTRTTIGITMKLETLNVSHDLNTCSNIGNVSELKNICDCWLNSVSKLWLDSKNTKKQNDSKKKHGNEAGRHGCEHPFGNVSAKIARNHFKKNTLESRSIAAKDVSGTLHINESVPVYDLTISGQHEFFANKILVHNSTPGGTGARTATVLMAEFKDETVLNEKLKKKWIVLDSKAWRVASAEREAIMQQTATLDKNKWGYVETWVEQEPGSGGKESAEGTVGNMAGFTCKIERVTGSKEVRADPFASQASVSRIKLLIGEWNQEYLDELEHFPVGKLKDLVDASGGAFNKLNGPTGAFTSTEGIRVGNAANTETFTPDTLSPDELGLE